MKAVRQLALVVLVALASVSVARAQVAGRDLGIAAETRPSRDVTLSFVVSGQVASVDVKDGDVVEANQVLVRLDDRAETVRLAQLKAQADNQIQIAAARAQRDQAKVDLEQVKEMAAQGAATKLEIQHAELEVTIAELKVELAAFTAQQDALKYQELSAQLERMRLVSPVAGRIERVHVTPGQSVDGLQEVVRLVRTDPLWVEVDVPVDQAVAIQPGEQAEVTFQTARGGSARGVVTYKAATAVGAIPPTLMVRVELSNASGRPAGEPVRVRFEPAAPVAQADEPAPGDQNP